MEITYENCENLSIPEELQKQFITFVELRGISKDYYYKSYINEASEDYLNTINEAVICIKNIHKLAYLLSKNEQKYLWVLPSGDKQSYIVDLLTNRQDITQLTVNGEAYYVPYDDHSTSEEFNDNPINYCQSNEYSPNLDQLVIKFRKEES
jgi:hypothetical protein